MLRVKRALETRDQAPIAFICDGVLFLENQPPSTILRRICATGWELPRARKNSPGPPHVGTGNRCGSGYAREGPHRAQCPSPTTRFPTTPASFRPVPCYPPTRKLQLICHPAPPRTGKRRNFSASGSTQLYGRILPREGHLCYIAPTMLSIWTYLRALLESGETQ